MCKVMRESLGKGRGVQMLEFDGQSTLADTVLLGSL